MKLKFLFLAILTIAVLFIPFTILAQERPPRLEDPILTPGDYWDGIPSFNPSNPDAPNNGFFPNNPSAQGISNPLAGDVNSIFAFVTYILENIVLPLGVVIVVFFVIYSGFLFVTAQGNFEKLQDARRTFLWVVIGAAILLGSVVIAKAIQTTVCKIAPNACYSGNFNGPRL